MGEWIQRVGLGCVEKSLVWLSYGPYTASNRTVKRLWGRKAMKSALFFSKLALVILNDREESDAREISSGAPFIALL